MNDLSDVEHQNIDWIGIHEKICQLLIPLKTPSLSTCNSEEEREHKRNQNIARQVSSFTRYCGTMDHFSWYDRQMFYSQLT